MTPAAAMTVLREALEVLASVDVATLSPEAQVAHVEDLHEARCRLEAAQARALAAADVQEASVAERGRATSSWLKEVINVSATTATRWLRVARRIGQLPLLWDAWWAGDVSLEHADVIVRCMAELPADHADAAEKILVELARDATPADVAAALDRIRTTLGIDESADEAHVRRYATRGVGLDQTFGSCGSLSGTLTPEVCEKLDKALRAASQKAGPEDERTPRQRRHDALGEIAQFFLSHADISVDRGERPRVVVTMPLDILVDRLEQVADEVPWATLGAGVPLSPSTARRLACDADLIPAVLGAKSEVLDLGRSTRDFNAAIRRAALLRQGGRCAFPRCRRRVRECHHIVWWSLGGDSSLDNAAWLCAFHHWLVHEGRWKLRRDGDGFVWTDPIGLEVTGRSPSAA